MVITVLEAHVAAEKAAVLQETYRSSVDRLDAGIVETFLLHSAKDAELWQIVTVWESRAALDAMRQSGETPRGVLIFRAAGAEPALAVYEVASHAAARS